MDQIIGKRFLPEHKFNGYAYIEVIKRNKNGTYHVQPVYPNGKKGSAGAVLVEDIERWTRKGLEGVTIL